MKGMGGTALWASVLVFAVSAAGFGSTVVNAVRVHDASDGIYGLEPEREGQPVRETEGEVQLALENEGQGQPARGTLRGIIYPRVTQDEILEAANLDLFQPDRTPPVQRYLLPNERPNLSQNPREDRRRREPALRIVGTALAGDVGLALVQLEDSIPFCVLLGEVVDGYRVAAVYEESVTLTLDDAEFSLPVMEPQRGGTSGSRDRNTRNQRTTEEAARALTERVQQMLQGMGRGQMGRGGQLSSDVPIARFQIPRVIEIQGGGQVPVRSGRPGGGGEGESRP